MDYTCSDRLATPDTIQPTTEQFQQNVEKIKSDFLINPDFDLKLELQKIINSYILQTSIIRLTPKKRKQIVNEAEGLRKLIGPLLTKLLETSPELLKVIHDSIPRLFEIMNIMDAPEFINNNNWSPQSYLNDTKITYLSLFNILQSTPKNGRGAPKDPRLYYIIKSLVDALKCHSKTPIVNILKCGDLNLYEGRVMDFILAIEPLLGELGLKHTKNSPLASKCRIGEITIRVIKEIT